MSENKQVVNEEWEAVINSFLQNKIAVEEENYLKDELKKIAAHFEKNKWFADEEIKTFFDAKKNKKSDNQTALAFQQQKWALAHTFSSQPEDIDWNEKDHAYKNKVIDLGRKFAATDWIEKASKNASSVSFATHVVKLTHSKIDTPSIVDQINISQTGYLTTADLREKALDGAVAGNQFAPIYQFLELECNGVKLAQELAGESSTALKAFARSDEELKRWNDAFKQVSVADDMATHILLKQVYFPVNEENSKSYHLLSQIISSSFAQVVFERLFNEEQKQIRAVCDKNKFSPDIKKTFPRRANIAVTASNHSNASQLNGQRAGKLHLLSAQPPTWQRQVKPPLYQTSWFTYGIPNYAVEDDIEYLRAFLLRNELLKLSTRDPKKKVWLQKWGRQIVEEVLYHADTIQALPAGWSAAPDIKLKLEHQYFLDPYRDDESFQAAREASDWEAVVCDDFARWLNKRLAGKDKAFTPQQEHKKLWMQLMANALRHLRQTLKINTAIEEQA